MKGILNNYNDGLFNLAYENKDFVSFNIPKNKGFDIVNLNDIDSNLSENIVKYILERQDGKIKILEDYKKFYNESKDLIKKNNNDKLKKAMTKKKNSKEKKGKNSIKTAKRTYKEELNKELKNLEDKKDKIKLYSKNLNSIYEEIEHISKNIGREESYIAYPYIEGKTQNEKLIRAPLIFFPVKLIKADKEEAWYIENINDVDIILNTPLLLAIARENNLTIENLVDKFSICNEEFIENIINLLKENNINLEVRDNKIKKFNQCTEDSITKYNVNELTIVKNIVLGNFKISNPLYSDYNKLLNKEIKSCYLGDLLSEKVRQDCYNLLEEFEIGEEIYPITSLDYSVEQAVRKASKSNKLIIYGDENTGKLNTIINIIGNEIAKNKRILVVCKDKIEQDKVYNRLEKINEKIFNIYDGNRDKKSFYEKIITELEPKQMEKEITEEDILCKTHEINECLKKFELINNTLYNKRVFGLNLKEMYHRLSGIDLSNTREYEDLKYKGKFISYSYKELKNSIDKIDYRLIKSYKNYKTLIEENEFLDDLNMDMNIMELDVIEYKIKELFKPMDIIYNKAKENMNLYKELIVFLKEKLYVVSSEDLENFSIVYNYKENKDLLNPLNVGPKINPKYWIKYFSNKKIEEENKAEFNKRKDKTINIVKILSKNIEISLREILIIKRAFNNRVFNLVKKDLLEGKPVTKDIDIILDAINKMSTYKNDLSVVGELNEVEIDLIDYIIENKIDVANNKAYEILDFLTLYHLKETEKEPQVKEGLRLLNEYENLIEHIKFKSEEKQEDVVNFIKYKYNNKLKFLKNNEIFNEARAQAIEELRLLPIRKYLKKYNEIILDIFPCFILNKKSVGEVLPLIEGLFHKVIFTNGDEITIEEAIPIMYRSKTIVIMSENNIIKDNYSNDIEKGTSNISSIDRGKSLLNKARKSISCNYLNYYYGAKDEYFKDFKIYPFHDGKLQIAPDINIIGEYGPFIESIVVNDTYHSGENMEEIIIEENMIQDNIIENLYKELIDCGYKVHREVGEPSYKIALGICNKEDTAYILGIEWDSNPYLPWTSVKEGEYYRRKFLEERGWNLLRVWSKNWFENPKSELERIKETIEKYYN